VAVRPHHNGFYYSRGPSSASATQEERRYHQQVEDISTKALVNVLETAGQGVPASFVRRLTGIRAQGQARVSLRSRPASLLTHETRLLLGRSILREIDPATGSAGPGDGGTRVDAAIHFPGQLAVFITTVDVAIRHFREAVQRLEVDPDNPDLQADVEREMEELKRLLTDTAEFTAMTRQRIRSSLPEIVDL
jgi:hypothetical protein